MIARKPFFFIPAIESFSLKYIQCFSPELLQSDFFVATVKKIF